MVMADSIMSFRRRAIIGFAHRLGLDITTSKKQEANGTVKFTISETNMGCSGAGNGCKAKVCELADHVLIYKSGYVRCDFKTSESKYMITGMTRYITNYGLKGEYKLALEDQLKVAERLVNKRRKDIASGRAA